METFQEWLNNIYSTFEEIDEKINSSIRSADRILEDSRRALERVRRMKAKVAEIKSADKLLSDKLPLNDVED